MPLPEDEDEDFPAGDGTADTSAAATCPFCWQPVDLVLDPGSGAEQQYEEDCEICCQPWIVKVSYDSEGAAAVTLERADE